MKNVITNMHYLSKKVNPTLGPTPTQVTFGVEDTLYT